MSTKSGLCLLLLLFLWAGTAAASDELYEWELSSSGVVNRVAGLFISTAGGYVDPIRNAALRLFWQLLACALVLHGLKLVFAEGSVGSFAAVLIKIALISGFFLYLINHGDTIAASFIDSLSSLTTSSSVGPAEMLDMSFNIGHQLMQAAGASSADIPSMLILYLLVLYFYYLMFRVCCQYVILYLSAYIMSICGIFVLGFGAFYPAREIAVNYLRSVLAVALQMMSLILVCNVGFNILEDMAAEIISLDHTFAFSDAVVIMLTSMLIRGLAVSIPALVGGLAGGGMVSGGGGSSGASVVRLARKAVLGH